MEKTARKPSTDPLQEKLRQNKALWNKEVSTFVNDLIHFKKTMNGWPSKFHKERSRIIEPVPADPATIIGSLAGDFSDIVNRGNALIQEQLNYSKNRRQKQPKQLNLPNVPQTPQKPPEPEAPKPDLSKQLSLGLASDSNDEYYLVSNASNPLTRFFARMLNVTVGESEGARVKRYRMAMLNTAANMNQSLNKLQVTIGGKDPSTIWVSHQLLIGIEKQWKLIKAAIDTFETVKPQGVSDAGGPIAPPVTTEKPANAPAGAELLNDPDVVKAMAAAQDFKANADNFPGVIPRALRQQVQHFEKADPVKKKEMATTLLASYDPLVQTIAFQNNTPGATSLAEVLARRSKNPTTASSAANEIERVAQSFVSKWWGKGRHLNPLTSDDTSAMRIDIYNNAKETKKLIDQIMNSLEKSMDISTLSALADQVAFTLDSMMTSMGGLTGIVPGLGYQPQFMQMMESGLLGGKPIKLDPKQRQNLEKMLKQKQLRDISRRYTGK